jgi:hypothetical protein
MKRIIPAMSLTISLSVAACAGIDPSPTNPDRTRVSAGYGLRQQRRTPVVHCPEIETRHWSGRYRGGPGRLALFRFSRRRIQTGGILRMRPDGSDQEIFADTEGWATGLHFDARGHLLALVLNRGLVSVARDGR